MHSFLFDAEHPELKDLGIFGPACTSRVVRALESLTPIPTTRLTRGKVIPESLCYDLGGFVLRGKSGDTLEPRLAEETAPKELVGYDHVSVYPGTSRVDSIQYAPDMERFKTVVCDLAETLSVPPSTVNEQILLTHLARGLVWSVGTTALTDEEALVVDGSLRKFAPYLGMAKLDPGNLVHQHVMIEDMFHEDVMLSPDGIFYRIEPWLEKADRDEAIWIAKDLGSSKEPSLVDADVFDRLIPPLPSAPPSKRGELSQARVAGKMQMSHRERLGRALLDHFDKLDEAGRIEFSTASEQGVSEFHFPPEKFTQYLLNLGHPEGKGKAELLVNGLDIQPGDWRFLANQIEQGMATAPIYRAGRNAHGFTHGAYVLVTGRNGKTTVLETGWIIEPGQPARFVTAYPGEASIAENLTTPNPVVVDPKLAGEAKWAEIYAVADEAGSTASTLAQPTPMVIKDYGTEWEGLCGRAWVHLPSARHPMAKWLVAQGKAHAARPGVDVRSNSTSQSLERHKAYADAFAVVLRANGIDCSTHSRLD